jgi:NAD(P)-dependent dehydrogenase (short-subunit alcohol dehydrogenase family)
MSRFADKTALITAAGRGIGRATALRLAGEGAAVTIWDVDEEALIEARDVAKQQGLDLQAHRVDMTDCAAIEAGVGALAETAGHIDVLVNNAGGSLRTPYHFLEESDTDWQRVMDLNVNASVRTTRAVVPHMVRAGYGRIINLGSKAGRFGSLMAGANYAAAKGAMQAMTLQLALEFGPHGITCNAVCPGIIMTPRVQGLWAERRTPEERQQVLESVPLRRHGEVEDVASAIAFLASDDASFITGVMLDVNGGQVMSI